jgi:beta-galactosidase
VAIKLGCAWYPEQWLESRWEEDLRLMKAAHLNVVRIGEYAWSCLEPADNNFEFEWFDRAIDAAIKHGLQVVLGTPTSSPPAWVIQNYPDTLQTSPEGRKHVHGNRGHYSPTSNTYRQLGARIVEKMAKRYGQNPNIIGWQLDNECWALSYDDECKQEFQKWLQQRYNTLDALNQHWSTPYWSQTYSDWSQIPLPVGSHNPGLMLDFKRFTTSVYRSYFKAQIDPIRRYVLPEQFITHNCLGFVAPLDYYEINRDLDLVSWDHYVGSGDPDVPLHSFESSLIRGLKQKNYWVMETQPGTVNWAKVNSGLARGETRAMAWHDIGHGADAVCYWQWRSAPNGQEQYHGNLIAQDGKPRPIYQEVAQLGEELKQLDDILLAITPFSEVAILHDYESRWALHFQPHHESYDAVRYSLSFYKPLRELLHNLDVISTSAAIENYRLVIAPICHILDEELANRLIRYVEGGGHLVLGARFGFKDTFNALWHERQPGPLTPYLGAQVEEYYALQEPISVNGVIQKNLNGTADIWAEWLQVKAADTEVLLRYGSANGWLDNQAAMVSRKVGAGRLTYCGAWFDENLMQQLSHWLIANSKLEAVIPPLPKGVELCQRRNSDKELYILINHTSQEHEITLPFPTVDLLNNQAHQLQFLLGSRAVKLLERVVNK